MSTHTHRPARSGCAINAAVEVLGDPWSMLVLRDLIFGNSRHFRALLDASEEGIATNILSSRLKRLVAAGLLMREETTRGQRAAYSLTEAGIQTLPVMVALGTWGLAHRDGTRELRVRAELLRDGGPDLVERLMDELRETHLGIPLPHPDRPRASEQLQAAYDAAMTGLVSPGGTSDSSQRSARDRTAGPQVPGRARGR